MKINKLLLAIVIVAGILRLASLGVNPSHLSPDEAALGYNAYSILETGRDEHGELFPLIFKSFGDFKPGLYVYLTTPAIFLFGLTEFAVRLPSALAGIAAVFLVYAIVKKLKLNLPSMPLAAAFFLSINPWHIQFSRGAWEANVALTLTLAGVYFFLVSFKKNYFLVLSSVFFALTLITYQGAKLSTLIVIVLLITLYLKQLLKFNRTALVTAVLLAFIVTFPILISFFTGQTGRLGVFSVFAYPRGEDYLAAFLSETGVQKNSVLYYLFYNEPLNFLRGVMGRFFNHFSGRFLFFEGDWQNPMFSPPYHGVLTLADVFLIIPGLAILFRNLHSKGFKFIALWLVAASLPAILSRDQVQAVRSLNMAVPLTIVLAIGFVSLWNRVIKNNLLKIVFVAIYLVSYIYYLDAYFVHFPKSRSNVWGYGYKQIVEAASLYPDINRVKVQRSFAQPYIYFLFFNKIDPKEFWESAKYDEGPKGDVWHVKSFGKYVFSDLHYDVDFNTGGLVAARSSDVPEEKVADNEKYKIVDRIKNPAGEDEFIVFIVNDK